jgi:hypothetical protein
MRTLKSNAGRLIERVLPKADAHAKDICPRECWTERTSNLCRTCCTDSKCRISCTGYNYCR